MIKSYIIIFTCLLLGCGCKKKEADPEPVKPDELVYQTTFDDNTWVIRTGNHYASSYSAGKFKIAIDTSNWFGYEFSPSNDINYNYSIEADVATVLNDPNLLGYGGFVYNAIDQQNYCILNIGTNGSFYIYQITNGTRTWLINTTVSAALLKGSGQLNNIKLKQYNNSLELIFNGVSQGSFSFQTPTQIFRVGVTANSSGNHYTSMYTLFDNFILKKIN